MAAKIFVVDDDESLLRLLMSAFKSKGYEVVSIKNGHEAIEYLKKENEVNSLSLLVLDRILPDMDGIEILRFFSEKYQKKLPVIILSSLSAQKDVLEGLKLGATDYLPKPFNIDVLLQKVEHMIK